MAISYTVCLLLQKRYIICTILPNIVTGYNIITIRLGEFSLCEIEHSECINTPVYKNIAGININKQALVHPLICLLHYVSLEDRMNTGKF